jgi:hypothetical protein
MDGERKVHAFCLWNHCGSGDPAAGSWILVCLRSAISLFNRNLSGSRVVCTLFIPGYLISKGGTLFPPSNKGGGIAQSGSSTAGDSRLLTGWPTADPGYVHERIIEYNAVGTFQNAEYTLLSQQFCISRHIRLTPSSIPWAGPQRHTAWRKQTPKVFLLATRLRSSRPSACQRRLGQTGSIYFRVLLHSNSHKLLRGTIQR